MCGIVGYTGRNPDKQARKVLEDGLKRLEYRGYDSAGIAVHQNDGKILIIKTLGKVARLVEQMNLVEKNEPIIGTTGIAHTRWATHGEPSQVNAHPHNDEDEVVVLVHNGTFENYLVLKEYLVSKGHVIRTETDTELLAHMIDEIDHPDPLVRVWSALKQIRGTYGVLVLFKDFPDQIIAARNGSPLMLGVGEGEMLIASDATPIISHTRTVVYLEDGQIARVTPNDYSVFRMESDDTNGDRLKEVRPQLEKITFSLEEIERGHHPDFMSKEITEQPESLERGIAGRVQDDNIVLGGVREFLGNLIQAPTVIPTACGTSYNAGLIGEILLEEFAAKPAEVKYASELANLMCPEFLPGSVFLAITQSGETKDTDIAVEKMQSRGFLTLGVCNVVGSTIARRVTGGIYTHAGPEIGVASTKAFTSQVLALTLLSFMLGEANGTIASRYRPDWKRKFIGQVREIPKQVRQIIENAQAIKEIAEVYALANNFLFLGRGINYPTALEGALKLKEISYIHAEGYPAAEMKHGPIALIDENMPSVIIAPDNDELYSKVLLNISEIRTRKGKVIVIANEGDQQIQKFADHVIFIPRTSYFLTPILSVIPLQLLAYYMAVIRKEKHPDPEVREQINVDKPRNLAKSVTVE